MPGISSKFFSSIYRDGGEEVHRGISSDVTSQGNAGGILAWGEENYDHTCAQSITVPLTLPFYDVIPRIERIGLEKSEVVQPAPDQRCQSGFCSESETHRTLLGNDPESSEYPLS